MADVAKVASTNEFYSELERLHDEAASIFGAYQDNYTPGTLVDRLMVVSRKADLLAGVAIDLDVALSKLDGIA